MKLSVKAFNNELFFINLIFFNPILFKYSASEIAKAVEKARKVSL
ncbi:hypothetical protein [Helicobacter pylori]|nr:hypothetical protein [Helicobacter pylori]